MVGKIQPKIPNNDDFNNQSASGVNQYGPSGASSPDQFQSYMNDGMTQGVDSSKSTQSPMEMMAQQQRFNFGPPTATQGSTAAPENFGPPGITQTTSEQNSFGAPGFQAPPNQNPTQGQQGNSANSLPSQVGAPTSTTPPPSSQAPSSNNNLSSGSSTSSGGQQPIPTPT